MVCVVARPLLIERCVGLREESGGERPCAISTLLGTVSVAANTYCMMDGHSSCSPCTVGPGSNLAVRVNRATMTGQRIQQEAICYQFKQQLILNISKPSVSQRSQIKEDTVESSVPAREFNLKAYAAISSLFSSLWGRQPSNCLALRPPIGPNVLPLINQLVIEICWWFLQTSRE